VAGSADSGCFGVRQSLGIGPGISREMVVHQITLCILPCTPVHSGYIQRQSRERVRDFYAFNMSLQFIRRERTSNATRGHLTSSSYDLDWSSAVKVEGLSVSHSPRALICRRECPVRTFELAFNGFFYVCVVF